MKDRSENLNFVILDRYCFCRVAVEIPYCWGLKLTTAQGLNKNNTLSHPVMKKKRKKEEKDEKSPKNWDPKTHEGKGL